VERHGYKPGALRQMVSDATLAECRIPRTAPQQSMIVTAPGPQDRMRSWVPERYDESTADCM